jgi:DNA-directed RNA polymerase subunit RPC12/RpoP
MAGIEIKCGSCGADDYQLLDANTGEVLCSYCRNKWIVPELIHKTETEKFLEEQAKQPRVVQDNTTDTDRALMSSVASLGSLLGNPLRGCGNFLSRTLKILLGIVVAILALIGIIWVVTQWLSANF